MRGRHRRAVRHSDGRMRIRHGQHLHQGHHDDKLHRHHHDHVAEPHHRRARPADAGLLRLRSDRRIQRGPAEQAACRQRRCDGSDAAIPADDTRRRRGRLHLRHPGRHSGTASAWRLPRHHHAGLRRNHPRDHPEPEGRRRHGPRQGRGRPGADRHRPTRQPVRRVLDHRRHRRAAVHVRPLPLRPCRQGHPRRRDRGKRVRHQHHLHEGARVRYLRVLRGHRRRHLRPVHRLAEPRDGRMAAIDQLRDHGRVRRHGLADRFHRLRHRADDPAGAVARLLHLPHARVLGGAGAHHDLPPAGHLRQLGIFPDQDH